MRIMIPEYAHSYDADGDSRMTSMMRLNVSRQFMKQRLTMIHNSGKTVTCMNSEMKWTAEMRR